MGLSRGCGSFFCVRHNLGWRATDGWVGRWLGCLLGGGGWFPLVSWRFSLFDHLHPVGGAASFGAGGGEAPLAEAAVFELGHGGHGALRRRVLAAVGAADVSDGDRTCWVSADPFVKLLQVATFGGEGDLFQDSLRFIGKPAGEGDAVLHAGGVAKEWIEVFSRGIAGEVDHQGQSSGLGCQVGGPVEQGFVDLGLPRSVMNMSM
jgi:hypothetical protein